MRFTHHAKLLALGAALAGLVIVPSIGEVSTATGEPACGPIVEIDGVDFHQVSTRAQLADVARGGNCRSDANYILTNDIQLTDTDWDPIPIFTGIFDGAGHTISGLTIILDPQESVLWGLFGVVGEDGEVSGLNLTNVSIQLTTAEDGTEDSFLGAIAGENRGNISGSSATGAIVTSGDGEEVGVGGLVGKNSGNISESFAEVSVESDYQVGGLVGFLNGGKVAHSAAYGDVTGRNNPEVLGGLVGEAKGGEILSSHAFGDVSNGDFVGGLVGYVTDHTMLNDSSARGNVSGDLAVGGLVGYVDESTISASHSFGNVSGTSHVGGLLGDAQNDVTVEDSSAWGDVTAGDEAENIGGLVGRFGNVDESVVSRSFSVGNVVTGDDASYVGGFIGSLLSGVTKNSYATGDVTVGNNSEGVANFIGLLNDSTIRYSYAIGKVRNGGGLVDEVQQSSGGDVIVEGSFWDTEASEAATGSFDAGRTTTQLTDFDTFSDADWPIVQGTGGFDPTATPARIWGISETINAGYPHLLWGAPCGTYFPDGAHEISTTSQLRSAGVGGEGQGPCGLGATYRLSAEVDLAKERLWAPIGSRSVPFTGEFDGNSNAPNDPGIVGLSDMATGHNDIGLFGALGSTAVIRDLFLIDFTVTAKEDVHTVGALAGWSAGTIDNVFVLNSLVDNGGNRVGAPTSSPTTGGVGGLVGQLSGTIVGAQVQSSMVLGAPGSGAAAGNSAFATGGVVGMATLESEITNTLFTGDDVRGFDRTGGLVGKAVGAEITSASVQGQVLGRDDTGGLVGYARSDVNATPPVSTIINTSSFVGGVEGKERVGGLVGDLRSSIVASSFSNGTVEGSDDAVGGLIGRARSQSPVGFSFSTSTVTGGDDEVGGLVGILSSSTVGQSFATGNVIANDDQAGGLVGRALNDSTIIDSYATGNVTGDDDVGGLVGRTRDTTITNSFSTGTAQGSPRGGLVGNLGTTIVTGSFWDITTSGLTESAGGLGEGRETADLQTLATFTTAGWSIGACAPAVDVPVWGILPGSYPFLTWQDDPQLSTCSSPEGPQTPGTTTQPQARPQTPEVVSPPALGGFGSPPPLPGGTDAESSLDGENILPTTPEQPGESESSTGDTAGGGTPSGGLDADSDAATTPQGMADIGWLVGIALGGLVAIGLIAGGVMFARART